MRPLAERRDPASDADRWEFDGTDAEQKSDSAWASIPPPGQYRWRRLPTIIWAGSRRTAAARSFFTFLHEHGIIPANPTEQIDTPKVTYAPPQALTPVQVDALLEDAGGVGRREPARDADRERGQPVGGHRRRELIERGPADQLLDQERPAVGGGAGAVQGDDVGVGQPRDRARLAQEPLAAHRIVGAGAHELDRDRAVEQRVVAEEHLAHPAVAERANDAELVEVGHVSRAPRAGSPTGRARSRGGAPIRRARAIARQILSGLAAIHRAQLIHGDMKSDNVLIGRRRGREHATIIDLGLARSPARPAHVDHRVSGTPEYMAPEQVRGDQLTAATDLYAVGVIVYEMLTGTTPFGGGSPTTVFDRQLHDDVVAVALRCPDCAIPPALDAVIRSALSKDAGGRPASAEVFAAALDTFGFYHDRFDHSVG